MTLLFRAAMGLASVLLAADLRAQDIVPSVEHRQLFDQSRGREVPVAIYSAPAVGPRPERLVLLSHGYGVQHTEYAFLATHLVQRGFVVVSVRHQLPGDPPLPSGEPAVVRRPSWEQGVANLLFVLNQLKRDGASLATKPVVLVGHSHGGDTSMLFAAKHPELVDTVLSLDNRRMPFPRAKQLRVRSIRSVDQVADPGVIPSATEREALDVRLVSLRVTRHDDMWDGATREQKAEMTAAIDALLGLGSGRPLQARGSRVVNRVRGRRPRLLRSTLLGQLARLGEAGNRGRRTALGPAYRPSPPARQSRMGGEIPPRRMLA